MSWMQYRADSRSFSSSENRPTRFRMRDEYLLPRFGGQQDDEESQETAAGVSEPGSGEQPKRAQQKGSAMENKIAEAVTANPPQPPAAYPGGRWRFWRNPFNHATTAKSAPMPVQTELRLETVKVVRNDLTDSDLLLVSPQSPDAAPSSAGERARRTEKKQALLGRLQQFFAGF